RDPAASQDPPHQHYRPSIRQRLPHNMASKLETLKANLEAAFGGLLLNISEAVGELTIVVKASDYLNVATRLRDDRALGFEQCVDLCGVDYQTYAEGAYDGPRFAAVLHLLSLQNNWRLRLRVF